MTVEQSSAARKNAKRDEIPAPIAQADQVKYFNAVDHNDRDSADYSTLIRTARYYLRIMCFSCLDRVFYCLCLSVTVCEFAKQDIGPEEWKAYLDKNGGRCKFQIDLGMTLINYGIGLEWDGNLDSAKPL